MTPDEFKYFHAGLVIGSILTSLLMVAFDYHCIVKAEKESREKEN
jgi:hypothetical protein